MKKVSMFILKKMMILAAAVVLTMGVSVIALGGTDQTSFSFKDGPYRITGSDYALTTEDTKYTDAPEANIKFKVKDVTADGKARVSISRKIALSLYTYAAKDDIDMSSLSEGLAITRSLKGDKDDKYYAFGLSATGASLDMTVDYMIVNVLKYSSTGETGVVEQ